MRLVLSNFMSLDGVVQAPGGPDEDTDGGFRHGGWSHPFFDPTVMGGAIEAAMSETRALLFGRRTWQTMAAAWPERTGDEFADRMNSFPKHVASRTLTAEEVASTWSGSARLEGDDAVEAVRALKASSSDGVLSMMGSPTFAHQLIAAGLVDEYLLVIEPIVLGGGKRLFPDDGVARTLSLASTTTASTGVQICTYRPAAVATS